MVVGKHLEGEVASLLEVLRGLGVLAGVVGELPEVLAGVQLRLRVLERRRQLQMSLLPPSSMSTSSSLPLPSSLLLSRRSHRCQHALYGDGHNVLAETVTITRETASTPAHNSR